AVAFDKPDPDAPFQVNLPGNAGGRFRREMVRVNHLRNCLMCHPPSLAQTDLIRGAIPDPTQEVPPPSTATYYQSPGPSVTAEVTFLRQDFSVVQPVLDARPWPDQQRFDFMVQVRRTTEPVGEAPEPHSPYRRAIGAALKALGGRDPENEWNWLVEL